MEAFELPQLFYSIASALLFFCSTALFWFAENGEDDITFEPRDAVSGHRSVLQRQSGHRMTPARVSPHPSPRVGVGFAFVVLTLQQVRLITAPPTPSGFAHALTGFAKLTKPSGLSSPTRRTGVRGGKKETD